jgi:hypothetical protein
MSVGSISGRLKIQQNTCFCIALCRDKLAIAGEYADLGDAKPLRTVYAEVRGIQLRAYCLQLSTGAPFP